MRNHDEFKAELLHRKEAYDQRRHRRGRRIAAICMALVVVLCLHFTLFSAAPAVQAENLLADITPNPVAGTAPDDHFIDAQMDFALALLKGSNNGGNTLVSPLSAMLALSMTANGAGGETLAQMEQVLCGGMDIGDWNGYLKYYVNSLPVSEGAKLSIANSIWYNDNGALTVKPAFLQTVADHYNADIFAAPFGPEVLEEINGWISGKTDGLINNALDELDGILYLINALVFDGKWAAGYTEGDVLERPFHTEDGQVQNADMMFSTENWYLESENATGFIKDYAGGDYRFVAILPNEELTLTEYLEALTPEDLTVLLENAQQKEVYAGLPQFEYECDIALAEVLQGMGITDAFHDTLADLSPMAVSAEGNLFIEKVIHKTFITVDKDGTKAAATTIVQIQTESAVIHSAEVILDRPFLYMIVDNQTNLPIFIGTLTDLG